MDGIFSFISENIVMIYILVLGTFLGTEVISKVPTVLHTPLMSGANAISGVVIIGAIWFRDRLWLWFFWKFLFGH